MLPQSLDLVMGSRHVCLKHFRSPGLCRGVGRERQCTQYEHVSCVSSRVREIVQASVDRRDPSLVGYCSQLFSMELLHLFNYTGQCSYTIDTVRSSRQFHAGQCPCTAHYL